MNEYVSRKKVFSWKQLHSMNNLYFNNCTSITNTYRNSEIKIFDSTFKDMIPLNVLKNQSGWLLRALMLNCIISFIMMNSVTMLKVHFTSSRKADLTLALETLGRVAREQAATTGEYRWIWPSLRRIGSQYHTVNLEVKAMLVKISELHYHLPEKCRRLSMIWTLSAN